MDKLALHAVVSQYKKDFPKFLWKEEKFKWEAVRRFQEQWDINSPDFRTMFEKATDKTYNLLAAVSFFPRGMILDFAQADMEATRRMFINLFDESQDLISRVSAFEMEAERLREKYDNGAWKNHFQTANSISTYLWLRFPDKYYIYKYSEYREASKVLNHSFMPKKGQSYQNLVGGFAMYDEIRENLKQDDELVALFRQSLTDTCYPDPELVTMTIDIGFYISRHYKKQNEWIPAGYHPGITKEQWLDLLYNPSVFHPDSFKIMKRMLDNGGSATCTELAVKYGGSKNFYNVGSSSLAQRVAGATGCPLAQGEDDNAKWWPILYTGKRAEKETEGWFTWKLRDELKEALMLFDMSDVPLHEEEQKPGVRYWWLNANPRIWSFSGIGLNDVQSYTLKNEAGRKRRIYQNFLDAKAGDRFIGYETTPVRKIVALGKVSQENDGERLYFEKTEMLTTPIDYNMLKAAPELAGMEFFGNASGSLFKLTEDEYNSIMDIVREENPLAAKSVLKPYTKEDFLHRAC